jgi:hypothetical protein
LTRCFIHSNISAVDSRFTRFFPDRRPVFIDILSGGLLIGHPQGFQLRADALPFGPCQYGFHLIGYLHFGIVSPACRKRVAAVGV